MAVVQPLYLGKIIQTLIVTLATVVVRSKTDRIGVMNLELCDLMASISRRLPVFLDCIFWVIL